MSDKEAERGRGRHVRTRGIYDQAFRTVDALLHSRSPYKQFKQSTIGFQKIYDMIQPYDRVELVNTGILLLNLI
jgi:hypothetical protein